MPRYFNKFPKLFYKKPPYSAVVTDLLVRVDTVKEMLDNTALFYQYDIQEGDTPEIIASKYYDDPELHWVVLMFNDMYDPYYDWPMDYLQFEKYITDKYGSIANAKTTVDHYEKIVETTDSFSNETTKRVYIIDLDSYNSLVPETVTRTFQNGTSVTTKISKRAVDKYDYEDELNESKRKIKLVRNDLIPEIKKQFESLMSE